MVGIRWFNRNRLDIIIKFHNYYSYDELGA
jgi:hypothetical protein